LSNIKRDTNAVIATNRFGLGARNGEIDLAHQNPQKWLLNGLSNIKPPENAPTAIKMMQLIADYKKQKDTGKPAARQPAMMGEVGSEPVRQRDHLYNNSALVLTHSIEASDSINWRLLDFFSNHFSVTAQNNQMRLLAPSLEWDAIAPNLMEPFENMLLSVVAHPAMLVYLNNERSIGSNSQRAKKRKKLGLNENLAREILELHTLGVNGGYQQEDVIELAKAITGWGVARTNKRSGYKVTQAFVYREKNHEPGKRTLLGKTYPQTKKGINQARAMLKDLAVHPSTAQHVCTKLARHFISDAPDPTLVAQMTQTWLKTNGNLRAVYTAMLESPLAWQAEREKLKTPREYVVSALRALDVDVEKLEPKLLIKSLKALGQEPYSAGSPAGFGDLKSDWNGSNALYARIEWASRLAKRFRNQDIDQLINTMLGSQISEHSNLIIKRAESKQQAMTLLLSSPDFLYR